MNIKRFAGIVILIVILIMGCSGNYGKFKPQTETESKVTQRELIDNWSDYDIWLIYRKNQLAAIIFDPKNDDRKISVESDWRKVKDEEMWKEIVNANSTSDGDFDLPGVFPSVTSGVQEIWGFDNQLYGFIIYQDYALSLGSIELVDENTIRLAWSRPEPTVAH